MIKASELRIGNYVKDAVSGEWMVVDELGENVGAVLLNRDKYPLPNGWQMDYIPLTPEILEKAGFDLTEETGHSWLTVFEGYVHIGYMFKKFPLVLDIDDNRMPLHQIKHLHQLQNLYFALTGEELTINL